METKSIIRKRIWEVDCLSLDATLAASFDWRELSNILQNHGVVLDHTLPGHILEMQVQSAVHGECHSENDLACRIEAILNHLYADLIAQGESFDSKQMFTVASNIDFENPSRLGGFFWAIASDPREEMGRVSRFLHQRCQVSLLRKMKSRHFAEPKQEFSPVSLIKKPGMGIGNKEST